MIEQIEKDVFYSALCNFLLVYVSDNCCYQQWSRFTNSAMITGVMRDKYRGVVVAGQPGDRLYKQIVFIAALECVAAFLCVLLDSKFDIRRSRVQRLAANSPQLSNNDPHTISEINYSF